MKPLALSINSRSRFTAGLISYCIVAAVIAVIMYAVEYHAGTWTDLDAGRFHEMARMIINGFEPYVSYIDPKPPLLFFTVALMDIISPAGSIDILLMAVINVICALLIWKIGWEDYGCLAGYTAGLLYLITAVFCEGYFLFSEQFTVLFLLLALILARRLNFAGAGLFLGLACGFKHYAMNSVIPLLYIMNAEGDRRYHRLLLPLVLVTGGMFAALYLAYGVDVGNSALYYTFFIAPGYITGNVTTFSTYVPATPVAWAANVLFSIAMVIPTLVFALASAARRGFRTPRETALGLLVLVLFSTLLIRQYLHYWILLMPFLALLACREFADREPAPPSPEPAG
jgi:hypothetical protein